MHKIKLHNLSFRASNSEEVIAISEKNRGRVLIDPTALINECREKGIQMSDLLNCTISINKRTLEVNNLDVNFVGQEVEAPDTFAIECSNGLSFDIHVTAALPVLVCYLNKHGGLREW